MPALLPALLPSCRPYAAASLPLCRAYPAAAVLRRRRVLCVCWCWRARVVPQHLLRVLRVRRVVPCASFPV